MAVTPCTHGIRPPEFPELPWINVDEPLRLKELVGKVVMVGFWSSSCVRCQQGLPAMADAMARFDTQALQIIAVHSPRFDGEHDLDYVRSAVGRLEVPFAVVVDNAHRISRMFNVRELPTIAIIDSLGYVCRVMRGVPHPPQIIEALEGLLGAAGALRERSSAHRPSPKSPTSLRFPAGVGSDGQHIVIADSGHHRLVVCDRQANVLRCVGGPQPGFTDGPSEETRFFRPHGLALYEGQVLVADTGNHAIRCVDLTTGHSDTLALIPSSLEGALRAPWSVSRQGPWLFVASAGTHDILRLDIDGTHGERFAGTGSDDLIDGHRARAAFAQPTDLALTPDHIYTIDSTSSALRRIDLHSNRVDTLVGKSLFEHGLADGNRQTALMQHPRGLTILGDRIYIADSLNRALRCYDLKRGELSTIEGPPLEFPAAIASHGDTLLLIDSHTHTIWDVDPATATWTPLELTWPSEDDEAPSSLPT